MITGLILAFLAGTIALPALKQLAYFILWALDKSTASGPCYVCSHSESNEIGERRNITVWLLGLRHTVLWSYRPWHRRAWAVHEWNPRRTSLGR